MLAVNLIGPAALMRDLMPELARGTCAVVNVGSIVGPRVHPFAGTAYACSKAALAALTREAAAELGPRGIRVNMVTPGEIETETHALAGMETHIGLHPHGDDVAHRLHCTAREREMHAVRGVSRDKRAPV